MTFDFMLQAVIIFIFIIFEALLFFLFYFLRPTYIRLFKKKKILKAEEILMNYENNDQEKVFALINAGIYDAEIVKQANLRIKDRIRRNKDESKNIERKSGRIEETIRGRDEEITERGSDGRAGDSGRGTGPGKNIETDNTPERSRTISQGAPIERKPKTGYFS